MRCLAFAYKELSHYEGKNFGKRKRHQIERRNRKRSHFLGLIGMADPPRLMLKAIELTRRAGIKVYIVTGDHGLCRGDGYANRLVKDKINIRLF